MTVFLEERGWVLRLVEPRSTDRGDRGSPSVAVRMSFVGGPDGARLEAERRLPGVHNYFLGNDESRWRTDVPLYASVLYRDLYPGIDMRMRQAVDHPEYDLLLDPGAALERISVRVDGVERLCIGADGELVIETQLGQLRQPVPLTWQTGLGGERKEIPCRYVLRGTDSFGFVVDAWDRATALTIDPGLLWSTFLGGSSHDIAVDVAVGASGIVAVAGQTGSADYPVTVGAYGASFAGGSPFPVDAFVSVLDPRQVGSAQLIYSTYLGGNGWDAAHALAVDSRGVVTLCGFTSGADFPTTSGAYDRTFNGGGDDGFVSCLDPNRSGAAQLVYSTFLGGRLTERAWELSTDVSGRVVVIGATLSPDYPTTPGAYDRTYNGPRDNDGFVSILDPNQTGSAQLAYSTFLGGIGNDHVSSVTIDGSGVVTVAGGAGSRDFPTTPGAYRTTYSLDEAFVSQLDTRQIGSAQLVYSTFLGGRSSESAYGLAVDAGGVLTIAGFTNSPDFPTTPGAFDTTFQPSPYEAYWEAFVSRLDPGQTGSSQLVYSTLLGGVGGERVRDLSVDRSGVITVTGVTSSSDFPTTPGAVRVNERGLGDAFVSRLDPSRTGTAQMIYSTAVGSTGSEEAYALGLDASGFATVTGTTTSASFPITPGAYATTRSGNSDAFVTRLDLLPRGVSTYGISSAGCNGPLPISVTSLPQVGNSAFSVTCGNAPSSTTGLLLLGAASLTTPVALLGVDLWVDLAAPFLMLPATSNGVGAADVLVPVPASPSLASSSFFAQFVWAGPTTPPPCPPLGLSASAALQVTIQP